MTSQIRSYFVEICIRGSILAEKKSVLKGFQKFEFFRERDGSKICTFGPTLKPRSPLKMGKTENNKYLPGNILTIGLYKYIRIKALLHSSLPEKCNYFLYYVGYFW